jgi:hypothetical protein
MALTSAERKQKLTRFKPLHLSSRRRSFQPGWHGDLTSSNKSGSITHTESTGGLFAFAKNSRPCRVPSSVQTSIDISNCQATLTRIIYQHPALEAGGKCTGFLNGRNWIRRPNYADSKLLRQSEVFTFGTTTSGNQSTLSASAGRRPATLSLDSACARNHD